MTDVFKSHEECEEPRVVLIEGQPGMGKTTYCQKLAYDWSVEDISPEASFPKVKMLLVLKCRDMKTANIEEAIDDQLLPLDADEEEKEKFFHFIHCNQSKILLVLDGLDGLDELSDDHFKALLPVIRGKRFSNTYLMLTARHEAGMKVRRHCDTLLEIVGYTRKDADSYIIKYFSNHQEPSLAIKLISELQCDSRLRELTTNPLNTALLCLLCEDTEGVFPSNRTKMYTELVSCAIRRYFAKKSVPLDARDPVETFSDNLNRLGKVALKALKADRMYFSEEEVNCQSIDFLRLCFLSREASVSKLRPMPCYAFTHKTFQEYFAAYHLTFEILSGDKDADDTLLAQLSPVGKYWQLWEFLLTMVASKSDEAATSRFFLGFYAAFKSQQTELTEEQKGQDSHCDDNDDNYVMDDDDFDICEDLLNEFPNSKHLFRWSLTEDEETRVSTLNAAFTLILKCEGGKNELTDSQKKMVQVLAESFPIQKLEAERIGSGILSNMETTSFPGSLFSFQTKKLDAERIETGILGNMETTSFPGSLFSASLGRWKKDPRKEILLEYLKSNSTLMFLSWRHELDDSLLETIEHVLRFNRTLKTLDFLSSSFTYVSTHFSLATILTNALRSNCTLTHLNLRCRSIFSPGANEIAQAIQSNHTLTHINLEGNWCDDSAAENFAIALRSGCALMYLDLSSNWIGDSGAVALGKALESNRTLTYLDLGNMLCTRDGKSNTIGDSGATAFAQALRSNSVLACLILQHNRISDQGAAALGLSLESNCTLTHLCLRGNSTENAGVAVLGRAPQVNCGIVNLDLRGNDLSQSEASAAFLAGALRLNSALTHLDLGDTFLGSHVSTILADSLQSNCTLIRVDLSGNRIDSSGGVALAKALLANGSLTHLNLRFNLIGDSGATEFVEALQTNSTLVFLDLRNNGILEAGAKKIHGFLRALNDTQISRSSRRTMLYNWRR